MLSALSIRNVLLIESIDLAFYPGLSVMTGETGAGKSVLLGSLVLVLGGRAERSLVRSGAAQAMVTATFEVAPNHPARGLATEAGLDIAPDEPLLLRRTVAAAGQSRAFLNDCAVSVQLLRSIGDCLAEIHGQHDERGLLDAASHRALVDSFANTSALMRATAEAFTNWREAVAAMEAFEDRRAKAQAEYEFLTLAVDELAKLAPQPDEIKTLSDERSLRLSAGKIAEDVATALEALVEGGGLDARLGQVLRRLEKADPAAQNILGPAVAALERTLIESREAEALLQAAHVALSHDPVRLEVVEDRLFGLRAAARKFNVTPEQLPEQHAIMSASLAALEHGEEETAKLQKAVERSTAAYIKAAGALSARRRKASKELDVGVNKELKPLKLAHAQFITHFEELSLDHASASGLDRVEFRVQTNTGTPPGPMKDIASGGELARFILALKVVLARAGSAGTLIFDEVDRGVGGAVADAVGERLAQLSVDAQVLVVTHSPQVAAQGAHHFRVEKLQGKKETTSNVVELDAAARQEEVARMLSGAEISNEARAAAAKLLEVSHVPQVEVAAAPRAKRKRAASA